MLVNLRALRALFPHLTCLLVLITLSGCLSRKEVMADVWLNSGMSRADCQTLCNNYCNTHAGKCSSSCASHPEQYPSGVYRALNTTPVSYEVISYCAIGSDKKSIVQHYVGIQDTQFNAILDALLPAKASAMAVDGEQDEITHNVILSEPPLPPSDD